MLIFQQKYADFARRLGEAELELARQAEIMHGDVERRIMRPQDCKPQRDEAVAVGDLLHELVLGRPVDGPGRLQGVVLEQG